MLVYCNVLYLSGLLQPADAGDTRDTGAIPGLGRNLGEGNGNPLHYSCLENPMDREAWQATVQEVVESNMACVTEHICTLTIQIFLQ